MATTKTKAKRRRGKGEGGLFLRSNGLWAAVVDLGYVNGKRVRREVSSKTKWDAMAKAEAVREEIKKGVKVPQHLTVADVVESWLSGLESSRKVKPTTLQNYRNVANFYVLPFVGNKRIASLTVDDVDKMLETLRGLPQTPQTQRGTDPAKLAEIERIAALLDELKRPKLALSATLNDAVNRLEREGHVVTAATGGRGPAAAIKRADLRKALQHRQLSQKKGVADSTRRLARTVLRMALKDAQRRRQIDTNVAALAHEVAIDDAYVGRTLTEDQARALIASVADHPLEPFVVVGLSLGLRPGETLGLRWEDIDLEAGTLAVSGTLARTDDGLSRQTPKNKKSRRLLPLPPTTAAALKRQRKRQAEQRLRAGRVWSDTGYILTNEIGEPLDPATARHAFQKITLDLFGEKWRPHEMRHSAASLLLAQGVPLRSISDILGHSSIQITSDVYAHMATTEHADVLNRLSSSIAEAK